jgi:hypothetical protein
LTVLDIDIMADSWLSQQGTHETLSPCTTPGPDPAEYGANMTATSSWTDSRPSQTAFKSHLSSLNRTPFRAPTGVICTRWSMLWLSELAQGVDGGVVVADQAANIARSM